MWLVCVCVQEGPTTDKTVFMAEMERDAQRRATERKQRDEVAQNLRKYVVRVRQQDV